MSDRAGNAVPILPRLSGDCFTRAPPFPVLPESGRVGSKESRSLPWIDNADTAPHSARSGRTETRFGASQRSVDSDRRKPSSSPPTSPSRSQLALWESQNDEEFSEALKAVRLWWQPVEASIRSRRVDLLQGALKEAHGESYLRTVYAVRRSASLDPVHRHSVEMEMAARLVKARAVLGKWQAGVEEIKKAHRARDVAGLAQALSRFQHSAEDAEVSGARQDLERWRRLAEELPKLLKDALERRDVPKLREAMSDMSKDGPKNIDGAEEAKKMIKRYQIRARALDHAVGERKISSIQAALATWDFSRDDVHAVKARQAIARRDQQKQKLQAAVLRKDGPHLQQVTQEWEFDRTDEDYQQAMAALRRYDKLVEDVERLMGPPMDIVALANVLDNWEWSKDDPVHLATEKKIAEHENAARNALQAKDGWKLQRIWQFNDVKKKGAAPSVLQQQMAGIKWKATVAKNRYREATHALREAIRAAVEEAEFMRTEALQEVQVPGDEDALQAPQENVLMSLARFSTTGLPPKEYELRTLVENWPFSLDDPTLQMASHWVASRALLKTCSLRYLDIALHGGHTVSITKALGRASAVAVPPRIYHKFIKLPENIVRGKEEALMREATLQAVGAMSLGVEPDDLMMASAFAKELADKARLVRMAVSCVEAGRIPTLRAASKPPRVVHGIMETICHCVAGIHPVVRDPPRDTGWRTCQRMMNNPKVLIENLTSLPDWVASGRTEPIERAKAHWAKVQAEVGRQQDCTVEAVRRQSILAGQFLLFLEQTFGFYELLSLANVAPEKRRGAHAIARDADAQRLSDLQAIFVTLREESHSNPEFAGQPLWYYVLTKAKGSLASDMLFSAAWAVAGGSAEAVRECVERARLQVMEALAVTSVSNAVLSNLCRGLRPPQREVYVASEPRRSSKFLTQLNGQSELGAKASLHRANKSIEASRAFKHNQTVAREVDVLIIRITGEEAALLHMPISSAVKDLQERLAAVESVPVQHQVLLFENKELSAQTPIKSLRRDRESVVFCTLYYKSEELVHRIEAAMLKIAQCSQLDLDMPSLLGGQLADPAICLIYGTSMFDTTVARPGGGERRQGGRRVAISVRKNETVKALGDIGATLPVEIPVSPTRVLSPPIPTPTSPRKQSLQLTMMDILRTTTELVRGHAWGVPRTGQHSVQVDTPWQMQVVCEILELSTSLLKKPLVPQANLSTSLRLLQELEEAGLPASYQVEFIEQRRRSAAFLGSIPTTPGTPEKPGSRHSDRELPFGRRDTSSESRRRDNAMDGPSFTRRETSRERDDALSWRRENAMQDSVSPPPVREADYQRGLHAVSAFVKAMQDFYQEFMPLRAYAVGNMSFCLQAEKAYRESTKVLRVAQDLENMCALPPNCTTVDCVLQAANLACNQLQAMAEQGIPIVYPHVEYVRCAIDSAGLAFLNSPPAAEPAQRLRWAEGIMSVQLAPLPSFDQTLKRIARSIDEEQLAELAASPEPPENMQRGALGTGIERLFAALAWVLDPQCNCDRRWSQSRQLLLDAEGFAEELASWTSASAEPRRMNRAKQLLMEVWTWVGSGCSGVQALRTLFCWLTLAVAITPVAEQGARLRPVHSIIKTGLQRVDSSPAAGRASAAAKAWTSVLFLLDSSAEAWWWLKGIRSSSQAPSPWTNSEDGGVGVANPMFGKPEDAWQQGEDPFDGNDPTAATLEFDRELDKEIDEVLKDDGGYAF